MNLREIVEGTGVAERHIRYLVAEDFMPSPRGGRSKADYGEDHAAAVLRCQRLRDRGFPPAAIRLLRDAREGVPFPVSPGITLVLDPALFGSGHPTSPLLEQIRILLSELLEDPRHVDVEPGRGD